MASKPIRPLPPEVIAQIKSSIIITKLSDVVIGLVRNSLDASATRISIIVDFARGGCEVEDDGEGIISEEFGDGGGLGLPYSTHRPLGSELLRLLTFSQIPLGYMINNRTVGMETFWPRCPPSHS